MSTTNNVMGFTAPRKSKKDQAQKQVVQSAETAMTAFDSGKSISLKDACHHTIIGGTTGCGKTASSLLPASKNLIENGCPGYFVDIKGNLTSYVRAIAKACGREDDIIEIGSELTATPFNILNGMNEAELTKFCESMLSHLTSSGDHNRHFHMRGVWMARDIFILLSIMAVIAKEYTPTLVLIADMLADPAAATRFFETFVQHHTDFVSRAYPFEFINTFINRVKKDALHIFTSPADKENVSKNTISTYNEQINYATRTLLLALEEMLITPGIVRNFCHVDPKQEPFSIEQVFTKNKIVISRYSPASGSTGGRLSRYTAGEFYKAVFKYGLKMPKGKYAFACYDEFQTFKDLSSNSNSDANFVDKSREFNTIVIVATQSLSALADGLGDYSEVNKFVSCCNNRILYYTDDPFTQSMVDRFDESVRLNELDGKAFVVTYDSKKRKHTFGVETVQNSYESVKDIIEQNPTTDDINLDAHRAQSQLHILTEGIELVSSREQEGETIDNCYEHESHKSDSSLPFTDHLGSSVTQILTESSPKN